jgi:hypothetical protein
MTENQAPDAAVTVGTEPAATSGSRGVRAIAGAAIAIVGVLAAVNPQSVFLRALHQAMPQIADAVPALITAVGAIVAAVSDPPRVTRGRS